MGQWQNISPNRNTKCHHYIAYIIKVTSKYKLLLLQVECFNPKWTLTKHGFSREKHKRLEYFILLPCALNTNNLVIDLCFIMVQSIIKCVILEWNSSLLFEMDLLPSPVCWPVTVGRGIILLCVYFCALQKPLIWVWKLKLKSEISLLAKWPKRAIHHTMLMQNAVKIVDLVPCCGVLLWNVIVLFSSAWLSYFVLFAAVWILSLHSKSQ